MNPSSHSVNCVFDEPGWFAFAIQNIILDYIIEKKEEKKSVAPTTVQETKTTFSALSTNNTGLSFFISRLPNKSLLELVVRGDEKAAKAILQNNPGLALTQGELSCTDFSGREITGSAFKAALCAGDVKMAEMMIGAIEATNDVELQGRMKQQFLEIFPNGVDAHAEEQREAAFDFTPIFNAIKAAKPHQVKAALDLTGAGFQRGAETEVKSEVDLTLVKDLNAFREAITVHFLREKIFNPHHLLRAFEKHAKKFDEIDSWEKHDLFLCQIIGFVQRFLPACYAQAFAEGLYSVVEQGKPLQREFKFAYMVDKSFYPLAVGCVDLGFHYSTDSGWLVGSVPFTDGDNADLLVCVETYVKQKQQAWKTYEETLLEITCNSSHQI